MAPQLGGSEKRTAEPPPPPRGMLNRMLNRRINRASVEEGFPLPCLPWSRRRVPLAAWDSQAEEWFFLANRKCHVGQRPGDWWRWVWWQPAAQPGGLGQGEGQGSARGSRRRTSG